MTRKASFIADQRGAVSLELPVVYLFLLIALLMPLADIAIAGFQFVSAWQALRGFGQSIQYEPPPDLASPSTWMTNALAKADPKFPITSIQLVCDGSTCTTTNTASPKYYTYSTTVTLAPLVLKSLLCTSGTGNGCTFTLPYSERFQ